MPGRTFRLFLPLLAAGLLAIQPASAAPPEADPPLPHVAQRIGSHDPIRVTAFGSSSTEGIGATTKDHSYPARLEVALSVLVPSGETVTVLNRGIGGEDVDDMMARLSKITAEKPDLVIWQTGSNDSLRSVQLDHFIAETRDGITRMRQAGIDVMLMEPQLSTRLAHTEGSDAFRDAVRMVGQQMSVPVIRRYDMMKQWLVTGALTYPQMMSGDGLHMTDGGYELLARRVAEMILSGGGRLASSIAAR